MEHNTEHEFIPMVPFMPEDPILARAYVPYQIEFVYFDPEEALKAGTLFPALVRPYHGKMDGEE